MEWMLASVHWGPLAILSAKAAFVKLMKAVHISKNTLPLPVPSSNLSWLPREVEFLSNKEMMVPLFCHKPDYFICSRGQLQKAVKTFPHP